MTRSGGRSGSAPRAISSTRLSTQACVEHGQVGGGGPAHLVDRAERRRAQLELAAGLDGEPAAAGQRA